MGNSIVQCAPPSGKRGVQWSSPLPLCSTQWKCSVHNTRDKVKQVYPVFHSNHVHKVEHANLEKTQNTFTWGYFKDDFVTVDTSKTKSINVTTLKQTKRRTRQRALCYNTGPPGESDRWRWSKWAGASAAEYGDSCTRDPVTWLMIQPSPATRFVKYTQFFAYT